MGADVMGRVTVEARVENLDDLLEVRKDRITDQEVRRIMIPDALVDTGATGLSLPTWAIEQLGLVKVNEKMALSSRGQFRINIYETVRLTVQGRFCHVDVVESPDEVPALIGQIPLEWMDWVVDPAGRRLIGNPEHGGEQMLELY